ncbi:MAG: WYL domain-containing protein [Gammaproteobacteria bacterium]|nr:WYL domain-containing protein [Gammaproteobacteria bacterium]
MTQRTMERDLNDLATQFAIAGEQQGNTIFWSWTGSKPFGVLGMSAQTALTLHLVREFLQYAVPPAVMEHIKPYLYNAEEILGNRDDQTLTDWLGKIRFLSRSQMRQMAEIDPDVLQSVYEALFEDRQLAVRYRAASTDEIRGHQLAPLGLVYRESIVELVAKVLSHGNVGRFQLHRMVSAVKLEHAVERPEDFDLDAHVEGRLFAFPLSGEWVTLKARVAKEGLRHVSDTPLGDEQTLEPQGDAFLLSARVRLTPELRAWLLGMCERIEVLEPPDLRQEVRRSVRQAAAFYADDE